MALKRTIALVKQSSLLPDVKAYVQCSEALAPWLCVANMHNENVPLRPIVTAIGLPTYILAKHLTRFLQPYIGMTDSFLLDPVHFLQKLMGLVVHTGNVMLSFDIVLLFTEVSVQEVLGYLGDLFPADIKSLFKHMLITNFKWDGIYEQTNSVAMVSPLIPVVTNFYMEKLEELAITLVLLKLKC